MPIDFDDLFVMPSEGRASMTRLAPLEIGMKLGEPEPEWHEFRSDRAAVSAAIKNLAAAYELRPVGEDRWILGVTDSAVNGTVVLRTDTATSTSVGLQLAPVPPGGSLHEAAEIVSTIWPSWVFLVIVGVALDVNRYVCMAAVLLVAMVAVPPVAGVLKLLEAARVRREQRWISDWRGRLLPALAARLAGERPYR